MTGAIVEVRVPQNVFRVCTKPKVNTRLSRPQDKRDDLSIPETANRPSTALTRRLNRI